MTRTIRLLLIALAGSLAYANSLGNGFVLDDKPIIVENPLIRRLSFAPRLLTENYWNGGNEPTQAARGGLYRPLPVFTYALNYRAGGLRPWGYHAVNVLLHLLVSGLLLLLLAKMGVAEKAAFSAALAFAVLPIHVEAVSPVVGRAELFSALFVLAAWLLAFQETSPAKLSAALACFGLALLSKESSAAFPLAFALSEGAFSRGTWTDALRKRGPIWVLFAMAVALYLYWRLVILGRVFGTGGALYFSQTGTLTVLLTMSVFFLRHYLFPMAAGLGLCADFARPQIPDTGPQSALGWLALAAVGAAVLAASAALARRKDKKALGAVLFLVLLFPVSNLLFKVDLIGAERFLYLPSMGFCMLLGLAWERKGNAMLGLAVLAWWTGITIRRNAVWRSEESLWAATVESSPRSPKAWNGLGAARGGAESRRYFLRALEFDPAYPEAMYNLGRSYFESGEYAESRRWLLAAAEKTPGDRDTSLLLGMVAEKSGDAKTALRYYQRTLELNRYDAAAHRNLGLLLYRLGRPAQARTELTLYLEYAPQGEDTGDVKAFLNKIESDR